MNTLHESDSDPRPEVMVGIDGSADSERAFRAGLRIAKQRDMRLRLVSIFPPLMMTDSSYVTMMNDYIDTAAAEAHRLLNGFASRAKESGVDVSTRAILGDPSEKLVAESRTAQLAVVGKRGQNRFAGRFLGSVSSKLASHGHCPTLVIPDTWETHSTEELVAPAQDLLHEEAAAAEPMTQVEDSSSRRHGRRKFANVTPELNFDSEIVAGVDLGDGGHQVARLAAEAARMLDRSLTLVSAAPLNAQGRWYANTVEHNLEIPNLRRPYTDQLRTVIEQVSEEFPTIRVRWEFFDGSAAGVLSEASRTATLVAIGTRGHGGFAGLMLGSVSQAVLNRAVCPVLVVPTRRH